MSDVMCPYCNAEQEICHDDGEGYAEDILHSQWCSSCEYTFAFTTSILYYYAATKADCLNDGDHKWESTHTYPVQCTRMECFDCGELRQPTPAEWVEINARNNEGTQ